MNSLASLADPSEKQFQMLDLFCQLKTTFFEMSPRSDESHSQGISQAVCYANITSQDFTNHIAKDPFAGVRPDECREKERPAR